MCSVMVILQVDLLEFERSLGDHSVICFGYITGGSPDAWSWRDHWRINAYLGLRRAAGRLQTRRDRSQTLLLVHGPGTASHREGRFHKTTGLTLRLRQIMP